MLAGLLGLVSTPSAGQPPDALGRIRVETAIARSQITNRVEPAFDPALVARFPGQIIGADVVVRADGTVEAVMVLVTPDAAFTRPTIAALKQWTFKPFVVNGRATRIVAFLDFPLADPVRDRERQAGRNHADLRLRCEAAIVGRAPDADVVCGPLIAASEQLHAGAQLERADAQLLTGLSLLLAGRSEEAVSRLEAAIDIRRKKSGDSDADVASALAVLGDARTTLNDLAGSAAAYTEAIAIFERAIVAVPVHRVDYEPRLAGTLASLALVKLVQGHADEARELAERATAVSPSPLPALMPAIRRNADTTLLGTDGPSLTDDDLRQLRAFAPAGRNVWLIEANAETIASEKLSAQVFLAPDDAVSIPRRGAVLWAEAAIRTASSSQARRTWRLVNVPASYAQVPIEEAGGMELRGQSDRNRPVTMLNGGGAPLADAELIALIRFIRTAPDGPLPPSSAGRFASFYAKVQPWVIQSVTVFPSEVEVTLQAGVEVLGFAQRVRVQRLDDGWKVVEIRPLVK